MHQKVSIVGNLGGDPELRFLESGTAVANFSVATNRTWTDQQGDRQKETTWFRVNVWGKLAEVCNQYLSKGRQVLVEGRLNPDPNTGGPRIWIDQQGQPRTGYDLTGLEVKFLGGRQDAGNSEDDFTPATSEDEIPF